MADNVTANSGSGGATFATDDIGGVHHTRVKIEHGADGSATDVSTASPLPVGGPAAHDAAASGSPLLVGGYASAAAPSDVSADADVVRAWLLRNGAQCVNVTAAGALIPGDATLGLAVKPSGNVAHDAVDSGNPLKIGAKAANAFPTAVANADRADALSDLFGRILTAHIDPAMAVSKSFNATSQQTGSDVWSPASGKRIAVTSVTISTYGTTGGRILLWFGDNADTTYTAGTDQLLEALSAVPSATIKPGLSKTYTVPVFCMTADRELHITTDAAISVDVVVHGYEY